MQFVFVENDVLGVHLGGDQGSHGFVAVPHCSGFVAFDSLFVQIPVERNVTWGTRKCDGF